MSQPPIRDVEVAPERLPAWLHRFEASHGGISWTVTDNQAPGPAFRVGAADGSWAELRSWTALPTGAGEDVRQSVSALASWARPPALVLLLVRRGGYAVAVANSAGQVVSRKVGTRHVQGRTAAGGWSQQRFARRREGQKNALLAAVAQHAVRIVTEGDQALSNAIGGLVTGGDRKLVVELLEELAHRDTRTANLEQLPRRDFPDLPDPRPAVLDEAIRRGRAVQVRVWNSL